MDAFFTKPFPFFCPPLDERIKEIANAETTEIVEMGRVIGEGHKISHNPLFTYQLFNCNAVVLLGDGIAGMSHYPRSEVKPKDYLPVFIEEMRTKSSANLKAIPIGGCDMHFGEIEDILNASEIPIAGSFCDELDDFHRGGFSISLRYRIRYGYDHPDWEGITDVFGEKFVVAIPSTQEVFMYSSATNVGNKTLYQGKQGKEK